VWERVYLRHSEMSEEPASPVARLFDEHVWDGYGFVAYRLGDRAEAEDVTQQTFERALKASRRFDPERAQPRTWLLVVARNLLVDHYRRDRTRVHRDLGEGGVGKDQLPAEEGQRPAASRPTWPRRSRR
jgi:RNA polymerase sigma factor (sigma-70 family)